MATDASAEAVAELLPFAQPRQGFASRALRLTQKQPVGAVSAAALLVVVVLAVFAPQLAPHSPYTLDGSRLQAPSGDFLLGTDSVGRDVLSRIIYGARISLIVGFGAVGVATTIGCVIGIASGYLGGKLDLGLQRLVDGLMGFPPLLLAMVLVSVLGASTQNVVIAISVGIFPYQARVIRSHVLSVKEEQFVLAAVALGATPFRVMFRAILPQVMPLLFILGSLQIAGAIIAEASLSFLGLGAQPPTASWGADLSGPGRTYMESAPWLVLAPGAALSITVLAFNLLGDSVRDVLDPRLRGRD